MADEAADDVTLAGVRLHDLRHTVASVGAGRGLGLPIIGKLLGHAQPSTTARYAHLADDPVKGAATTIGNAIAAALGASKVAKVVPIGRASTPAPTRAKGKS